MPFIGQEPLTGAYHVLDAITTSATATYNLQLNSGAFSPATANQLLVSLNGVIQKPGSSFTISGSQITFSSALTSSDSIDFIIALGDVLSVGTPTDGSVSSAKLSSVLDLSGTGRTGHGGLKSVQVFTSSGTYTKPAGISTVKVTVTGGGGGGGGGSANWNHGGGGAAGGTAIKVVDVSSISTVTVTVGGGGGGGAAGATGGGGGTSSFGSHCSATGGGAGIAANTGTSRQSGGVGSGGDINITGGQGDAQAGGNDNDENTAGHGGMSFWGGGGQGTINNHAGSANMVGTAGQAFGSGGGAGRHNLNDGTNYGGADGKAGVVYVEEYA